MQHNRLVRLLLLGCVASVGVFASDTDDITEQITDIVDEIDGSGTTNEDVVVEDATEESTGIQVDGFSTEAREQMEASSEKHEFQAEVNRLMDIIINSLYTEKEVFLRELVSNAADALEKARFHSVQDPEFLGEHKDLEIKLEFDESAKTLSIIDTGVGMTKDDLINNLGTVAKSGTSNFLEMMKEGSDQNLIGQFGVGFYSAFLVADKVTVTSKNNDSSTQHVWESAADASYSVAEDPRGNTLGRGSRITLQLKEDAMDLLSEHKLKELCGKYSQFVQFPIYVKSKKEVEEEADDDDDDEEEEKDEDDDEDEKEKEKKMVKKTVYEWDQVNTQKAIWMRPKEDITSEEYNTFYKAITKDYQDALAWSHFSAEGEIEFRSILYVPSKAPFDMRNNYNEAKADVKLYVRRVLVAEAVDDLLPKYLSFVKGVVDSDDLPLNVSREQLQQNKVMKVITKKLVRKALEMIRNIAKVQDVAEEDVEEPQEEMDEEAKKNSEEEKAAKKVEEKANAEKAAADRYNSFYREFGEMLTMGCLQDDTNRSKIAPLLRFKTSKADDLVSLDGYKKNFKENQESIYYMSGESAELMKKDPSMQAFLKRDLEVLFLDNPLLESCLSQLSDFDGSKLVSIQKGDVKFEETEEEKKHFKRVEQHYQPLTSWMKDTLSKSEELKAGNMKIDSVKLSKRLVESPCVVVASSFGHSAQMERAYKSQMSNNKEMLAMMGGSKVLELNPNHPVIVSLLEKVKADKDDASAKSISATLFQTAMLQSGFELQDPSVLAKMVFSAMSKDLGVDPNAPLAEIELPDEEPEEEPEKEDGDDDDDEEEAEAEETPVQTESEQVEQAVEEENVVEEEAVVEETIEEETEKAEL